MNVVNKAVAIEEAVKEIFEVVSKHHQEDGVAWIEMQDSVSIVTKHGLTQWTLKTVYPQVRSAIAPDTLEVFKEPGSGKRIALAMSLLRKDATPEGRAKVNEAIREKFPNVFSTAATLLAAEIRLGLREGKSGGHNDDKEVALRVNSGPQSEIQLYVAQYQKLIERKHSLEIELTEVDREIEKYKPIMRAMDMMRDGIKYIKENAK